MKFHTSPQAAGIAVASSPRDDCRRTTAMAIGSTVPDVTTKATGGSRRGGPPNVSAWRTGTSGVPWPCRISCARPRAVAGEEAAALEDAAQFRLEIGERLGEAVAHRAGLSGQAAARNPADHVVLAIAVGDRERLADQHAQHRTGEIDLELAVVDHDLAGAALEPDAGDRVLALAGRVGAAHICRASGRISALPARLA